MAKIVGIDLGTTNSVCAVMEAGEPTVIPSAEGGRLFPSVVAFAKNGERLVGQTARRQAVVNSENTVFSIKRLMGRRYDDPMVEKAREILPYEIVEGPAGDARVYVPQTSPLLEGERKERMDKTPSALNIEGSDGSRWKEGG